MKLAYKLYVLSKKLLASYFSGIIVTYEANTVKTRKFKKAIDRAIAAGYLGKEKGGDGDHHAFSHVDWLGERIKYGYDEGKKSDVAKQYVDNLIMLCAKVKTILDKAQQTNTTLPLKNNNGRNMNLEQYENYFGITKQIAQQNVNYVANKILGK